ncbi:hypothetical protein RFI_31827 [Reticulomyxa filosa]|uniref:Uncharacterized protein n=1 Tax=Reticulomyxa filosa TaxID=46433 RepID=X6LXW0_RETFI|nr:hypothetical protein RFI_31827 [Reticulomyxa filosa]|eukprot:ETO05570.1 hypothetical protein RFI_31827 [Reticulomyxa filosa]
MDDKWLSEKVASFFSILTPLEKNLAESERLDSGQILLEASSLDTVCEQLMEQDVMELLLKAFETAYSLKDITLCMGILSNMLVVPRIIKKVTETWNKRIITNSCEWGNKIFDFALTSLMSTDDINLLTYTIKCLQQLLKAQNEIIMRTSKKKDENDLENKENELNDIAKMFEDEDVIKKVSWIILFANNTTLVTNACNLLWELLEMRPTLCTFVIVKCEFIALFVGLMQRCLPHTNNMLNDNDENDDGGDVIRGLSTFEQSQVIYPLIQLLLTWFEKQENNQLQITRDTFLQTMSDNDNNMIAILTECICHFNHSQTGRTLCQLLCHLLDHSYNNLSKQQQQQQYNKLIPNSMLFKIVYQMRFDLSTPIWCVLIQHLLANAHSSNDPFLLPSIATYQEIIISHLKSFAHSTHLAPVIHTISSLFDRLAHTPTQTSSSPNKKRKLNDGTSITISFT